MHGLVHANPDSEMTTGDNRYAHYVRMHVCNIATVLRKPALRSSNADRNPALSADVWFISSNKYIH